MELGLSIMAFFFWGELTGTLNDLYINLNLVRCARSGFVFTSVFSYNSPAMSYMIRQLELNGKYFDKMAIFLLPSTVKESIH